VYGKVFTTYMNFYRHSTDHCSVKKVDQLRLALAIAGSLLHLQTTAKRQIQAVNNTALANMKVEECSCATLFSVRSQVDRGQTSQMNENGTFNKNVHHHVLYQ